MIVSIIGRFLCDSLINLHFHFMTDYINFPSYFLAYISSVSDTHNQENKKKEKSFSNNLQYSSKANLQIQLKKWPLHLFVDFILFSFLCLGWPCITALPFCPFSWLSFSRGCWWGDEPCGAEYHISPSTCCSVFHLTTVVRMQVSDLGIKQMSQICSNPGSDALLPTFI